MFVRKRDPRYKSHLATQAAVTSAKAAGRVMHQPDAQKPRPSTKAAPSAINFVEQAWQKTSQSDDYADLEWATAEKADDSEEWECVACGKTFRTEAAWNSHERSKKHMQAVERLKQEMREEDEFLEVESRDHSEVEEAAMDGHKDNAETPTQTPPPSPPATAPLSEGTDRSRFDDREHSTNDGETSAKQKKSQKKQRAPSPELLTKTERRGKTLPPDILNELHVAAQDETISDDDKRVDGDDVPQSIGLSQQQMSKRDKRRARDAEKKAKDAAAEAKSVRISLFSQCDLSLRAICRLVTYAEKPLGARQSCLLISARLAMHWLIRSDEMKLIVKRKGRKVDISTQYSRPASIRYNV